MMKNIEDICFLILAKSNSERLPRKMHRKFSDTTLLDVAINKFLSSDMIPDDQICVAVYGDEVLEIAQKYKNTKIKIFERTENSVSEGASVSEIYEALKYSNKKYFIEINACCPLLTTDTINQFTKEYLNSESVGMFGVLEKRTFYWNSDGYPLRECTAHLDTKTANIILEAAHCLYAGSTQDILKNIHMGSFSEKGDPDLFVIKAEKECWDIDYKWQFEIAENMFEKQRRKHV